MQTALINTAAALRCTTCSHHLHPRVPATDSFAARTTTPVIAFQQRLTKRVAH